MKRISFWLLITLVLLAIPLSSMAAVTGVYWTDRNNATLNFINLNGINTVLATGLQLQDVDLDSSTNTLYFSDSGTFGGPALDGSINRVNTDGTGLTNIFTGNKGIHQLALDSANSLLYFTRANLASGWELSQINMNGLGYAPILTGPALQRLSGLALDAANSLLYFGDVGAFGPPTAGSVNSVGTNGLGLTQLTPRVAGQGRGMAFDAASGTLFLTAHAQQSPQTGGEILSYNIGTGTLTSIIADATTGYWDIQIDPAANRIYYTDYARGQIRYANFDGTDQTVFLSGLTNPYGLALQFPSNIVPTMNKWGIIIFIVLAGLGAIYFIRRKRI